LFSLSNGIAIYLYKTRTTAAINPKKRNALITILNSPRYSKIVTVKKAESRIPKE
jgi:hypothetical protein